MSTLVFVAPGSSTQADGAQSSRVPVPLPEDPCEAIRQAYLDGMDTESEPFEDPVETETPESPLTIAPHISLSESTPPILVPILRRIARMAMRVPPAMSSGLSASMAEVAAMSESVFCKRFRSSYESSPSLSPSNLPLRKSYQGTSELVEDSEEDDDEEDEEIEECMDSDSVSKDAEDEGPTAEDEDPAAGDEGLTVGVEALGMDDESYGLDDESHGMDDESRGLDDEDYGVESDGLSLEEEEEAVPGGQRQVALVVRTAMSTPLGLGYGELRRRELALEEDQTDLEDGMVYIDVPIYPPLAPPVQTPPSPEWTSDSLPISPSPSIVPSPISSHIISLTIPSPVATLATAETEEFLTELGAQVEMERGLIHDHAVRLEELSPALFERYDMDIRELFTRSRAVKDEIFSQRYQFRSLEYEQERVAVTFGAIWRPVLALESWAELAEVVDGMRRGQEPRGVIRKVIDREWSRGSIGKSGDDQFGNLIIFLTMTWIEQENKKEDKKMFREKNKREKMEGRNISLLVPSCFAVFNLEPLSLSFDFVFTSEIFKSLSFCLNRLCCLAILCLDQHAHTLHHLESLLTISLDRLDILKEDFFEHDHVVMNPTSAGMRHLHLHLYMNPEIKQLAIKRVDEYGFVIRPDLIQRISLTGFPAQSVGSSNTDVLDLPCLLVLITGTSQSRQHDMSESDSYYLSD
ncbi:hypothetical protein Tco_0821526 [Tanacetum coccineum]|uniref:Uncharacterized protein n=1 Tax=Tanacetum coccineum TaxID=301880 RepID=A0ABQ5AFM7_9ASTR